MRLKEQLPGNAHEYTARWQGNGPALDHLDQLCEDIYAELSAVMLAEAGLVESNEPLEREVAAHAPSVPNAPGCSSPREYLEGDRKLHYHAQPHPMTIWGASGSGKSALMARAIEQAQNNGQEVLFRFIGATPDSSNGRALLESLCRQSRAAMGRMKPASPRSTRISSRSFPGG